MSLDLFSCMKSFAAIVEHGSFYKASQHLYISPPVLTKQMKFLEELMGTELLHRTTRTMGLTEAGELYLNHVRKILYDIENAKNELLNIESEPHGLLKIGVPGIFDYTLFANAFAGFLEKYPKINLHIINENLPSNLTTNMLDIIITENNINDIHLCKDYLYTVERCLLGAPAYFKKYGMLKNIEDLKNHNCLININTTPTCEWVFNNKKVKVHGNYISNSSHNIYTMASLGLGLTWIPKIIFRDEIESGLMIEAKLKKTSSKRDLWAYSLQTNNNNVRLFKNCLKEFFESLG